MLRENMQPELRFINDLLSAESEQDALALLEEQADSYGPPLLDMIDAVERAMAERGDEATVQKLIFLREQAEQVLS